MGPIPEENTTCFPLTDPAQSLLIAHTKECEEMREGTFGIVVGGAFQAALDIIGLVFHAFSISIFNNPKPLVNEGMANRTLCDIDHYFKKAVENRCLGCIEGLLQQPIDPNRVHISEKLSYMDMVLKARFFEAIPILMKHGANYREQMSRLMAEVRDENKCSEHTLKAICSFFDGGADIDVATYNVAFIKNLAAGKFSVRSNPEASQQLRLQTIQRCYASFLKPDRQPDLPLASGCTYRSIAVITAAGTGTLQCLSRVMTDRFDTRSLITLWHMMSAEAHTLGGSKLDYDGPFVTAYQLWHEFRHSLNDVTRPELRNNFADWLKAESVDRIIHDIAPELPKDVTGIISSFLPRIPGSL